MKYEFKPSFGRSIKSLSSANKEDIKETCSQLIDILSGEKILTKGFGLKNLRDNFWEIRKSLKFRILFRWQSDHVEFILAGTHDEIKRFLKN